MTALAACLLAERSNYAKARCRQLTHRSLDRRQLFGLVRCLPNGNFRVGG
jgi:hypothetical protein